MKKKRCLKTILAVIMTMATISEGPTLTWGSEFSSGMPEESPIEAEVSAATASYNNNWRCWNQGQSDNADMRAYGCWVTAQAKLLYETGVDRSASFNPDTYLAWQKANGYINSRFYQTNGGVAPVAYANQKGKNLEYLGNWNSDAGQLWFNINAGYYTIVAVPGHYVYLDNEKSKATGQLYCDDSSSTIPFNSPQPLSRYNSWNSCYVYKSNGNGASGGNSGTVNTSWSEWEDNITETNANIYGKIDVGQKVQFTGAGVSIWDASGNLIHQSTEGTKVNYNYMQISYNLQNELGVTLSPGQTYTYQMFADFGGKRYYGNKKTFTTHDSAKPDIGTIDLSWDEWVDGISRTNANIYGKISTSESVQFTGAGVSIWDASGTLIHQSTESTSVNYNYMQISYNLQGELGVTLSPGQIYTYQMFADFGGKRYYGNKKTFTTLPGATNVDDTKVVTPNPTLESTKKRQIQLSWAKYNSSDKYQIQYCRNRFFIGAGKKNTAANDYTLVNLKSKNRYYIRVRSYRKIGSKNVYSAWSKVKSIKVK